MKIADYGAVIVIMANKDKVEMESAISERIPDLKIYARHLPFGHAHGPE